MTIKLARQSAGLTQRQLADQTGINIRQIQKVESGEIKLENLTAANYIALCQALSLDPNMIGGNKMTKGDIRGNYCVYTWKNDGSDPQLLSKHEWKYEAFAAHDKWNKENADSGRTAGVGWIYSDGRIEGYLGS